MSNFDEKIGIVSSENMEKKREELKSEILANISPKEIDVDWYELNEKNIDDEVINDALRKYKNVYIPYIGVPIVLNNPIIMSSNTHLKVAEHQILMQGMESDACLIRNENIQNGKDRIVDETKRDKNISLEGGIWNIRTSQRCKISNTDTEYRGSLGSIIFSSVENFSIRNLRVFDSYICGPKGKTAASYGIQLSNCKDFIVENIDLHDNHRDGVHINGPAEYGLVRHIRGDKAGDDLVALSGWDWFNSALSFGPISHIYIDDVNGAKDEFRLLPGQKVFSDGTKLECDIKNCVIENICNLYTVKIYEQHNIENPWLDFDDSSGTVGNIDNIFFNNISFIANKNGFFGTPVNGLFDVCCNFTNAYFENISVEDEIDACEEKDLSLIKVGPLTYFYNENVGEVFNPDSVAYADNIFLKDIKFADETIKDKTRLVTVVNKENENYRLLSLGKGKGYGEIGKLEVLD